MEAVKEMTKVNTDQKIFLSNEKMDIIVDYSDGVVLQKFALNNTFNQENLPESWSKGEFFVLNICGEKYPSSLFSIIDVSQIKDETQELATIILKYSAVGLCVKICFLNDMKDTINFIVQVAVNWTDGIQKEVYLQLPFLSDFATPNEYKNIIYYPANPFAKKDGSSIMQLHKEFPLPLGIFEAKGKIGLSIDFPTLIDHIDSSQNRNLDFRKIASFNELKDHNLLLRPNNVFADVAELKITALEDGWYELFTRWRDELRNQFHLKEYRRDDLAWNRDCLLHHFAFVYGKEVFDYDNVQLDIDKLLDQGEEFGGYDVVILWHQYPRLGVDQRNQWDFFDDFPGGREGIKQAVKKAHDRGSRVLLPFKPWDIGYKESFESISNNVADLVRDTDIDGFFLDTMNNVPESFRNCVDNMKKGVIFCSEGHPWNKPSLEILTSSWDQYWNTSPMPETDLLRYVLPEHISPIIARWHVGIKKDMLIQRAVFNGTGIVIWQDIFGSWLPYNVRQKTEIKKWKKLWLANKDAFLCSKPIPLYPTLIKGLYCNMFPEDDGNGVIYTLYNDNEEKVSGSLVIHRNPSLVNVEECWNGEKVSLEFRSADIVIQGTIHAKQISVIKSY